MALTWFRLASPVNFASRTAPTAPLRAHRPQNLSCGGITGGAGSLLRTSLHIKFPAYQGIYREFCRFCRLNGKSGADIMHHFSGLQLKFPTQHSREFFWHYREFKSWCRELSGEIREGVNQHPKHKTKKNRAVPCTHLLTIYNLTKNNKGEGYQEN
jgi:hypothetical protein